MPTYTFKDKTTGEVFDVFMKLSERDQYKEDNPNLEPVLHAYNIVGGVSIGNKESGAFQEAMARIGEHHPGSEVANRYTKKSTKQIKVENFVKKHIKPDIGD